MCCGGTCLVCIPVRIGSLIFGYIIAILSALGTLGCTGSIMYFGVLLMCPPTMDWSYNNGFYSRSDLNDQVRNIISNNRVIEKTIDSVKPIIICTGLLVQFLSSFICTVLMLVGISQNKPKLIKTFLIYGMIQVVLLMVFFIIFSITTYSYGALFPVFVLLVVYSLCLYMVHKEYLIMTGELVFLNPARAGTVFSS